MPGEQVDAPSTSVGEDGGRVIPQRAAPAPGPLAITGRIALAAEILVAYARVRWWLRRRGLPAAVAALRAGPRPPAAPTGGRAAGARLARRVVRTMRLLPTDSRCLMRSLVLIHLLARRGMESKLVLGVRPGEDFAAHAWVEHGGIALLHSGGREFHRLVEM